MHAALVHFTPILAAEKSKTPFFIAGGVLVAWALFVSLGIGLRVSGFPRTAAAERTLMAVTAVLVVVAASMAVATSGGSTRAQAAGATTTGATTTGATTTGATTTGATTTGATTTSALSQEADPSGKLRFVKPRLTARAGRVSIVFTNHSPLAHNLTIASSGKVLGATPTFEGGSKTLALNLKPGTYKFFCSVPGHREAGMEGTLVVS